MEIRMQRNITILIVSVLATSLCAGEAAPVAAPIAAPTDREPTAEETLILEFMNRLRAEPQADIERIAPGGKIGGWVGMGVDVGMFVSEMKALKAAPPLVFNLDLLDSARKHSIYMIHNGLTHVEQAGKPGFVAADFSQRCKLAGYTGGPRGECCFRDAMDPWHSHCGFTVDTGKGGPGGMQPGRGHRTNMMSRDSKEIGCSAIPHEGRISVTHNYGSRNVRMAGGVVYFDRNNNGFYDIGEGAGGVKITSSDGAATESWKSGAFELDLKKEGSVTLTAEFCGQKATKTFDAGKDNVKFDWIVPEKAAIEKVAQLLAAVDKVADTNSAQYFNAVVALYLGAKGLAVDGEQQKRVAELTKKVGPDLEGHQKAVLEELQKIDPKSWRDSLAEHQKAYRSTIVDAWFKDAELIGKVKLSVVSFEKKASEMSPSERRGFVKQVEDAEKGLTTAVFKQHLATLVAQAKAADQSAQKKK
jgi:hypothetical protein